MSMETMMSKDRLKQAFNMFDRDGSGQIGADEIRQVLNLGKNSKVDQKLQEIIKIADEDGNGEISLKEFEDMMTKI